MFWRTQILATAKAHGYGDILFCDCESFLDPSVDAECHRKDQFLLSWILSLIAESMLGYVSRCEHSCELWKVFDDLFRSQSRAMVINLRFQLKQLRGEFVD